MDKELFLIDATKTQIGQPFEVKLCVGDSHDYLLREDVSIVSDILIDATAVVLDDFSVAISGTVSYQIEGKCDKCLKKTSQTVFSRFSDDIDLIGSDRQITDYFYDGKTIDFEPIVRDLVMNYFPLRLLCSEDCLGICPICGTNRNEVDCGHIQTESLSKNPFQILNKTGGLKNGSTKKKNI